MNRLVSRDLHKSAASACFRDSRLGAQGRQKPAARPTGKPPALSSLWRGNIASRTECKTDG